jgi:hypothetical protein
MKCKMDDAIFGIVGCCFLGFILLLIFTGERNTRRSSYKPKCDCDWEFDGENGSNVGAFYRCKKCGKSKYIPYKELMGMSDKDYQYWTTRPMSQEEKMKQELKKNKTT